MDGLGAREGAGGPDFQRGAISQMVTSANELVTPIVKRRRPCPRCEARLIISYDGPQCIACGYTDYSYTPPAEIGKDNLISQSTQSVYRYMGESRNLKETLIHARLQRVRNRVVHSVVCPFCQSQMEESPLSGKRREQREKRYRCPKEHRVSLIPKLNGDMGWR